MVKKDIEQSLEQLNAAFDRWYKGERERQLRLHDYRIKTEAMRRISTKYKRIHNYSEYILNSVYTYSSVGVLVK